MKWTLLWVIISGLGGAGSGSATFETEVQCIRAAAAIMAEWNAIDRDVHWICISDKGEVHTGRT